MESKKTQQWQVAKVSTTTGRVIKRVGEPIAFHETAIIICKDWQRDPRFQCRSGRWAFRVVEAR